MDNASTVKLPIKQAFEDVQHLIQEKYKAELEWLQYKTNELKEDINIASEEDYDYEKLCEIDCREKDLFEKLEREVYLHIKDNSTETSKQLGSELNKAFKDMLQDIVSDSILPKKAMWTWQSSLKLDSINNINSHFDVVEQENIFPLGMIGELKGLNDLLNQVQARIDALINGQFIKNKPINFKGKVGRRVPLDSIFLNSDKWNAFLRICENLAEEAIEIRGEHVLVIKKQGDKFAWIGQGRGDGLPQLAAFIFSLDSAGFLIHETKMVRYRSFLAFFQKPKASEKYLSREFNYPRSEYTRIFSEKIMKMQK